MRSQMLGRFDVTFVVVCALFACASSSSSAHPFHVSFAEAEWNAGTKSLEVALKLHPNDLEQALRRLTKRRIKLEANAAEAAIVKYLRNTFVVKDKKKRNAALTWVGSEISVKEAWLYFEFSLPDGLENISITNSVMSHVQGQKNTVFIRDGKRRTTLVFSEHQVALPVKFTSSKPQTAPLITP